MTTKREENGAGTDGHEEVPRCSFCNKSQKEVETLIAGPTVFICNECVDICVDILAQGKAPFEVPFEVPPK